jgi:glyoxylase-like metal-dependent hydrolase (beta-lactamase superfamily II)
VAYTTLEDFFGDIVGKARRGRGLSEKALAEAAGLTSEEVGLIEAYELTPEDGRIRALAGALHLDGEKLLGIAKGWVPDRGNAPHDDARLSVERTILDVGMEVNAYALKCKASGEGAIVDAGGHAERIFEMAERMSLKVTHVLLTHGHADHVGALAEIAETTGARVCCCKRDFGLLGSLKGLVTDLVDNGWRTNVGRIAIDAVSLPGHTAGGIGYGGDGMFFSGDALFAGSMGGALGPAYAGQITAVVEKVLCRNEKTRVFPGHGPITSVAEELAHNPFFAR